MIGGAWRISGLSHQTNAAWLTYVASVLMSSSLLVFPVLAAEPTSCKLDLQKAGSSFDHSQQLMAQNLTDAELTRLENSPEYKARKSPEPSIPPECEAEYQESLRYITYPATTQFDLTQIYLKPKGNGLYVNSNWIPDTYGHTMQVFLPLGCANYNQLCDTICCMVYVGASTDWLRDHYSHINLFIDESFFEHPRWKGFDFGGLTRAVLVKKSGPVVIFRDSADAKQWKLCTDPNAPLNRMTPKSVDELKDSWYSRWCRQSKPAAP